MPLVVDTDLLADSVLEANRRTIPYSHDLAKSIHAALSRMAEMGMPITWIAPRSNVTFAYAIGYMQMSVDCLMNGLLSVENCIENLEQCGFTGALDAFVGTLNAADTRVVEDGCWS